MEKQDDTLREDDVLSRIRPVLNEDVYVFCTLTPSDYGAAVHLSPLCSFTEDEGPSIIVTKDEAAQAGLVGEFESRMITLSAVTSLNAVGILAAISAVLAKDGIGVNVVSAFYHDYLFVRVEDADRALSLISRLQADATLARGA